jgi:hypothetical protein
MESYEKVLNAWISLKSIVEEDENSATQLPYLTCYAQMLVEAFIESRLSLNAFISGDKEIQLTDDGVDSESIDEDEASSEDDLHRYKEVLYAIGEFARYSLNYSLPVLAKYFIFI